jgi:hypothetical protein
MFWGSDNITLTPYLDWRGGLALALALARIDDGFAPGWGHRSRLRQVNTEGEVNDGPILIGDHYQAALLVHVGASTVCVSHFSIPLTPQLLGGLQLH